MVGTCERCGSAEYALMCDSCNHKLFSSGNRWLRKGRVEIAPPEAQAILSRRRPPRWPCKTKDLKGQPRTIGAGTEAIC